MFKRKPKQSKREKELEESIVTATEFAADKSNLVITAALHEVYRRGLSHGRRIEAADLVDQAELEAALELDARSEINFQFRELSAMAARQMLFHRDAENNIVYNRGRSLDEVWAQIEADVDKAFFHKE